MITSAPHAHLSLFICPPPATEFYADCASSTTTFHRTSAQVIGSISHRICCAPSASQNDRLPSTLLSVSDHVHRRCCLIPRWSPRHLPPVVDDESPARHGAVVQVHFELLFSLLRTAIGFIVECAGFVLCALSSLLYLDIMGAAANLIQRFCKTSHAKLARTTRIPAFALVACCILAAPLCAKSQVCNCYTFEL